MAVLHLLRHAKSDRDQPALADHERPLNPRGEEAAVAMGRHMARNGVIPDLILCSSATRTRQTLDLLVKELTGSPRIEIEERLYLASSGQILRRLRELPEKAETLLLIAHNPGIHEFAAQLAAASPGALRDRLYQKYPTGAWTSFRLKASWRNFGAEDAELLGFVTPAEVKG